MPKKTAHLNPFACGYHHLEVQRVLIVSYDDDNATHYCAVHPSQARLKDDALDRSSCILNGQYALAIDPDQATRSQAKRFPQEGVIRAVLRRLISCDSGERRVAGYAFDDQMAQQMITRLSASAGGLGRSWEISASHLDTSSSKYLDQVARGRKPSGEFFEAFRMPTSNALGIKLLGTLWTVGSPERTDNMTAMEFRQSHFAAGMPESLISVLYLAAQAGVRFVVFHPKAAVLDGLPTY